jgi:hypothetical protein
MLALPLHQTTEPLDYLIRNIHAAGTLDDAAGRSPMSTGRCERALDAFARETRRVTRATRPSAGEPAPPRSASQGRVA